MDRQTYGGDTIRLMQAPDSPAFARERLRAQAEHPDRTA